MREKHDKFLLFQIIFRAIPSGIALDSRNQTRRLSLQIYKRGDRVRLYTITDVDWTDRYPWIGDGAKAIKLETAILEAER